MVDICLDPFEVSVPHSLDVFHTLLALQLADSLYLLLQTLQFDLDLLHEFAEFSPFVHKVA